MSTDCTKSFSRADLAQFTGTDVWYRHTLVPSIRYTDGVQYVAEVGGAYWLLDEIALSQRYVAPVMAESFQLWVLAVDLERHSARLRCENRNGGVVFEKQIEFTDFPLNEIRFFVTDRVILLQSEY